MIQVQVGNIYDAKVTGITNFGAFVEVEPGVVGLVHISEVSKSYVKDIKDHVKEGDVVKVKALSTDPKGKISFSISKAMADDAPTGERPARPPMKRRSKPATNVDFSKSANQGELDFEDKMKLFMQSSEERISSIKRNLESKRGGGYRR